MARLSAARAAALSVFSERRRRDARARDLLRASAAMERLDARDRALASRLVLGAVAATGELDRVLESHLRPGAKLEPRVRDALRLAAFEILYLDTPESAAVSQGVELVRSVGQRAAGLANAVLRRVADEDARTLAEARARVEAGRGATSDLARVAAAPEWLCERVIDSLGEGPASDWAADALAPAGAWVAANRVRHVPEDVRQFLEDAGCEPFEGPVAGSFGLAVPARLNGSGLVERVDALPCDLASQEVAELVATHAGTRVLEVGQGRGTKTILLEGACCERGGLVDVVSVEVDPHKSELSSRRCDAAGCAGHVTCVCRDGRELDDESLGTFDLVFVDAPCTGSGTLARHPEIAWSLSAQGVAELSELQAQLLRAASTRVAHGGTLAYATCSVLAQEDEAVVDAFLAQAPDFTLLSTHRTGLAQADRHFLCLMRRA